MFYKAHNKNKFHDLCELQKSFLIKIWFYKNLKII